MKTIALVISASLVGMIIALAIGWVPHPMAPDESLKASTFSAIRVASQVTPTTGHDLVLTLQAAALPVDLSSPPSALDGAPALPSPPR